MSILVLCQIGIWSQRWPAQWVQSSFENDSIVWHLFGDKQTSKSHVSEAPFWWKQLACLLATVDYCCQKCWPLGFIVQPTSGWALVHEKGLVPALICNIHPLLHFLHGGHCLAPNVSKAFHILAVLYIVIVRHWRGCTLLGNCYFAIWVLHPFEIPVSSPFVYLSKSNASSLLL